MMLNISANSNKFQKNTNFLGKDGLIHNLYIGDQTVFTLTSAHDDLVDISEKLREKGKHVLVLTDITRLGKLDKDAKIYAIDFIKDIDFDKVAIFGRHMVAEQIINIIITASGRGYKMKYFISREDALLWLSY